MCTCLLVCVFLTFGFVPLVGIYIVIEGMALISGFFSGGFVFPIVANEGYIYIFREGGGLVVMVSFLSSFSPCVSLCVPTHRRSRLGGGRDGRRVVRRRQSSTHPCPVLVPVGPSSGVFGSRPVMGGGDGRVGGPVVGTVVRVVVVVVLTHHAHVGTLSFVRVGRGREGCGSEVGQGHFDQVRRWFGSMGMVMVRSVSPASTTGSDPDRWQPLEERLEPFVVGGGQVGGRIGIVSRGGSRDSLGCVVVVVVVVAVRG